MMMMMTTLARSSPTCLKKYLRIQAVSQPMFVHADEALCISCSLFSWGSFTWFELGLDDEILLFLPLRSFSHFSGC